MFEFSVSRREEEGEGSKQKTLKRRQDKTTGRVGGVEEKAGDKNMEENRGEKRRGYITKRRVGRNRETSGGVGGYKLWKGANATDAGYREGGGGERGRNLSEWHQSAGLMRLAAITCISTT